MRRPVVAAIVAPPIAMLVFWAGSFASATMYLPETRSVVAAGHSLFFFLFFGIPLSYLGAYLLALPAYLTLSRYGRLTRGAVVTSAMGLGAVWAPIAAGLMLGFPRVKEDVAIFEVIALLGAISGGAGAAVFAVLAVK